MKHKDAGTKVAITPRFEKTPDRAAPKLLNANPPIVTRENSKTRPVRVPEIVVLKIVVVKIFVVKFSSREWP
jgi:hypothetical protein